ncbi:hypothetical protein [Methylobacterium sp. 22177]|uniref:hypothetical protein n=1 Tax=Methylobacterium sp. 22177 TaxID=3453885 RepID=UPI003F82C677
MTPSKPSRSYASDACFSETPPLGRKNIEDQAAHLSRLMNPAGSGQSDFRKAGF